MDIVIAGHRLDSGDAFQTYARAELTRLKDKYFARAVSAHATLSPGPRGAAFACELVMHVSAGVILKASGRAARANQAFDAALERIDKQLRRYVRRLHDHVGAPPPPDAGADDAPADYRVFETPADDADEPPAAPLIVAEAKVDVPAASVADAVMMLDLRNTTALLFRNTATGAFNMVYRREDGNIGWVEPGRGA